MNFYKKISPVFVAIILGSISVNAQVKFKLALLEDGITYKVSLVPEVSYLPPFNRTSTAQVTIKAPSGGVEVENIINLQPEVEWDRNSLTVSPEESPEYDYVSFGLISSGTKNMNYEAGVELPLFTFINTAECQGKMALIDNSTDPFYPPNSRQVNVGNQITILGANGDAYTGNMEDFFVSCGDNSSTAIEDIDRENVNLSIFPNPAKDYISLNLDWDRDGEGAKLVLLNMVGKEVYKKEIKITEGKNIEKIGIQHLARGIYFMEIRGEDWKISSDQFVKMNH